MLDIAQCCSNLSQVATGHSISHVVRTGMHHSQRVSYIHRCRKEILNKLTVVSKASLKRNKEQRVR